MKTLLCRSLAKWVERGGRCIDWRKKIITSGLIESPAPLLVGATGRSLLRQDRVVESLIDQERIGMGIFGVRGVGFPLRDVP